MSLIAGRLVEFVLHGFKSHAEFPGFAVIPVENKKAKNGCTYCIQLLESHTSWILVGQEVKGWSSLRGKKRVRNLGTTKSCCDIKHICNYGITMSHLRRRGCSKYGHARFGWIHIKELKSLFFVSQDPALIRFHSRNESCWCLRCDVKKQKRESTHKQSQRKGIHMKISKRTQNIDFSITEKLLKQNLLQQGFCITLKLLTRLDWIPTFL